MERASREGKTTGYDIKRTAAGRSIEEPVRFLDSISGSGTPFCNPVIKP